MKRTVGIDNLAELNSDILPLPKGVCGSVQLIANHQLYSNERLRVRRHRFPNILTSFLFRLPPQHIVAFGADALLDHHNFSLLRHSSLNEQPHYRRPYWPPHSRRVCSDNFHEDVTRSYGLVHRFVLGWCVREHRALQDYSQPFARIGCNKWV